MSKKKRPAPVVPEELSPLFDSHTHLSSTVPKDVWSVPAEDRDDRYAAEVERLMDRAAAAGVRRVCTVGDGMAETELAFQTAQIHPSVWVACAIHPTRANELNVEAKKRLTQMASDDRCVAIGETGLDKYWIEHDPDTPSLEMQEAAFRWHIDLAVKSGKPLMIHNRDADEDLFRILDNAPRPSTVILHCFSSSLAVGQDAIRRGYVLSFAGNSTFKRNEELRELVKETPADQILVETDAPYMTPEPYRGARNEPAFVGYTARALAEVRGESPAAFAATVWRNANRVFGLAAD